MCVRFRGLADSATYIYPNPQFCGRNYAFSSQTRQILKLLYSQNYCTDRNQILHNDGDHQVLFVDGPNALRTNPRWWTAAIFFKSKNRKIATTPPILTKFSTGDASRTSGPRQPLKFRDFQNPRWWRLIAGGQPSYAEIYRCCRRCSAASSMLFA